MALTKITSHVIGSGAVTAASLSGITTDNVSEGSSNTYFTNARARGSVSVTGGNLSYDSSTGVIQLTTDTIRSRFSAGTGISISSGSISTSQDISTSATPTFGNITLGTVASGNITTTGYLRGPSTFTIDPATHGDNTGTVVIAGNLQVDGTTTTINSTTLTVDDKLVTLASGSANAGAANGAGIEVDISGATNPSILYDGTDDEFDFNKPITIENSSSKLFELDRSGTGNIYDLTISDAGTGAAQLFFNAQTNDTGFLFRPKNSSGNNVNALLIAPDGQLLINKTGSDVGASTNIVEADGNFRLQGGNRTIKFNNGSHEIVGIAQIASHKMQYGSGKLTIDVGNSKVGIGTQSPSKLLHLSEAADGSKLRLTRGGVSEWDFSIGNSSTLTGVGSGALEILPQNSGTANELAIGTAGSTAPLVHITNSQNYFSKKVGIGTTSLDGQLHVRGTTNKTLKLDPTFSSGTYTTLAFARNGTDKWRIFHPADDSYLSFYNDQASLHNLGMSAAGDVMIGSTTVRKDLSSSQGPTLSIEGAFPTLNLRDTGGTAAFYGVNGDTVYVGGHTSTAVLNSYVNGNVATELRSNRMVVCANSNEMRIVLGSTGDPTNNTSNWIRGSGSTVMYNAASGDHRWEVGGAEKMRLYSTGEVTKSANPAFRAYTSTEWTSNGIISSGWNDSQYSDGRTYDIAGNFNVSNGRFTAPKTGIYLFTVMWDSNGSQAGLKLMKNTTINLVAWEPTGRSDDAWESKGYSTTVKLTANDFVQLQTVHASGSYPVHMGGAYWGHFSGVLLG